MSHVHVYLPLRHAQDADQKREKIKREIATLERRIEYAEGNRGYSEGKSIEQLQARIRELSTQLRSADSKAQYVEAYKGWTIYKEGQWYLASKHGQITLKDIQLPVIKRSIDRVESEGGQRPGRLMDASSSGIKPATQEKLFQLALNATSGTKPTPRGQFEANLTAFGYKRGSPEFQYAMSIYRQEMSATDADINSPRYKLEKEYQETERETATHEATLARLEEKPALTLYSKQEIATAIKQMHTKLDQLANRRAEIRKKLATIKDADEYAEVRAWAQKQGGANSIQPYRFAGLFKVSLRNGKTHFVKPTGGGNFEIVKVPPAFGADAVNHLGEREYQTYYAWRAAAKAKGATRFEGDKDIAHAFNAQGKSVGEWLGDKGSIYKDAMSRERQLQILEQALKVHRHTFSTTKNVAQREEARAEMLRIQEEIAHVKQSTQKDAVNYKTDPWFQATVEYLNPARSRHWLQQIYKVQVPTEEAYRAYVERSLKLLGATRIKWGPIKKTKDAAISFTHYGDWFKAAHGKYPGIASTVKENSYDITVNGRVVAHWYFVNPRDPKRGSGWVRDGEIQPGMPSVDADQTETLRVTQETFNKLEVGKNYKINGRRCTVLRKDVGTGQKSAAGLAEGGNFVKVKWRDAAPDTPERRAMIGEYNRLRQQFNEAFEKLERLEQKSNQGRPTQQTEQIRLQEEMNKIQPRIRELRKKIYPSGADADPQLQKIQNLEHEIRQLEQKTNPSATTKMLLEQKREELEKLLATRYGKDAATYPTRAAATAEFERLMGGKKLQYNIEEHIEENGEHVWYSREYPQKTLPQGGKTDRSTGGKEVYKKGNWTVKEFQNRHGNYGYELFFKGQLQKGEGFNNLGSAKEQVDRYASQ